MAGTVDARLEELGITLPEAAEPVGNYSAWTRSGDLIYISGQLPMREGNVHYVGRVGRDFDITDGQGACRLCTLNMLAQLRAALEGDLDRVRKVVRLGGFISSTPDFGNEPQVMNGASDLMVDVFGEAVGLHARAAVGVYALPRRVAAEIEGLFEVA